MKKIIITIVLTAGLFAQARAGVYIDSDNNLILKNNKECANECIVFEELEIAKVINKESKEVKQISLPLYKKIYEITKKIQTEKQKDFKVYEGGMYTILVGMTLGDLIIYMGGAVVVIDFFSTMGETACFLFDACFTKEDLDNLKEKAKNLTNNLKKLTEKEKNNENK